MVTHVGFTGTRKGLTEKQARRLRQVLADETCVGGVFHHGDCVGADAEADAIAYDLRYWITIHPCNLTAQRAGIQHEFGCEILQPKDPLVRNRDIVRASELLVACPGERQEVLRSGTWATIRFARQVGLKQIHIIYP